MPPPYWSSKSLWGVVVYYIPPSKRFSDIIRGRLNIFLRRRKEIIMKARIVKTISTFGYQVQVMADEQDDKHWISDKIWTEVATFEYRAKAEELVDVIRTIAGGRLTEMEPIV